MLEYIRSCCLSILLLVVHVMLNESVGTSYSLLVALFVFFHITFLPTKCPSSVQCNIMQNTSTKLVYQNSMVRSCYGRRSSLLGQDGELAFLLRSGLFLAQGDREHAIF